jgi:hypothetical protein
MKAKILRLLVAVGGLAGSGLYAQEVGLLMVERSHVLFQDGENSSVPAEQEPDVGLRNFYFMAGAELDEGTINPFTISGPGGTPVENIPYEGPDDGYNLEEEFSTELELMDATPAGNYTFNGTGSSIGAFSESLYLASYSKLTRRLVTNYTELQSFDPAQPVTINWEPFVEGQGANGGVILVDIFRVMESGDKEDMWSSDEVTPPDAFGLDPSSTSVEVPAGVLTGSPIGTYEVAILFIRIEHMEELSAPLEGTLLVSITSMELYLRIKEETEPNYPYHRLVLTPGAWLTTNKQIDIYGYDEDWGYSRAFGLIFVPWTPHWFYQSNYGWMTLGGFAGNFPTGMWLYSELLGFIYVKESWGEGVYWSDQAKAHFNMIDP